MLTGNESPVTIAEKLSERYGLSWIELDIEVLEDMLFKSKEMPALLREKIRAIRVCNASAIAWRSFEAFSPVVQAFCGKIPVFNRHIELTPGEVAIGVHYMNKLRKQDYTEDIPKIVAVYHMNENIFFSFFNHLSFCKPYIDPYDKEAEALYKKIESVPADKVELEETPEGVQAALAYANRLYYLDTIGSES